MASLAQIKESGIKVGSIVVTKNGIETKVTEVAHIGNAQFKEINGEKVWVEDYFTRAEADGHMYIFREVKKGEDGKFVAC